MKSKLFFLSLFMTLAFSINYAQTTASDTGIAIQGIARDNNNTALANKYLSFKFSLYHSNPPQIIFEETKNITTDAFGVFSYVINVAPAVYTSFAANQVFLKIQDVTTGTIISDEVLKQVPYAIAASNGVPMGSIMPFIGTVAPSGWVLCNGQSLKTVLGAAGLIALLGSDTAPDLKGMFLRGTGISPVNGQEGPALNKTQGDEISSHDHATTETPHSHEYMDIYISENEGSVTTPNHLGMTQSSRDWDNSGFEMARTSVSASTNLKIKASGGLETRPVNYGVNYIIKL